MIYCTLFNSNYLDKAKVMIDSLKLVDHDMVIYVLCMDDITFDILTDLHISGCKLIKLGDFEDDELLSIKGKRSPGEYCWTCTAKLIEYVLLKFNEEICTYVDADLYFYSNPSVLIDEMKNNNCSVQIVPHNFPKSSYGKKLENESGKYCVQFNTFTKDEKSMRLLKEWISQCINECSVSSAGDQQYLSSWDRYSYVNISKLEGAGVAPWNVGKYELLENNDSLIRNVESGKSCQLLFYHFQNVVNFSRYKVKIHPLFSFWRIDKRLIKKIYYEYLIRIEEAKSFFENEYHFLPIVTSYISDKRPNYFSYFCRFLKHPFKETSNSFQRIKFLILSSIRKKEGVVDVRLLKQLNKENGQYDNS